MLGFCALALAVGTLASTSGPARATTVRADWKAIQTGLQRAVKSGRLDASTAAEYRADAENALGVLPRIPPGRGAVLASVLHEVAAQAARYDAPRALALFSMLAENASYFAAHPLPTGRMDVADDAG